MTSSKPKLLFVYYSKHPVEVKDGLWAALELLKKNFLVSKVNIAGNHRVTTPDFVLGWGAWMSPVDSFVRKFNCPRGLCIAGNAFSPHKSDEYDVLFYETKWYQPVIGYHKNIVHAFGVNTDIYYNMELEKDIDYLGVGAFARWKRWEKMKVKSGVRFIVGEFQGDNISESGEIWEMLEDGGVFCVKMVKQAELNLFYNRAKVVYIPAVTMGGGERAVFEARACECKVEIESDNPKLKELLTCDLWNHHYYYRQLKKGIESCLKE